MPRVLFFRFNEWNSPMLLRGSGTHRTAMGITFDPMRKTLLFTNRGTKIMLCVIRAGGNWQN
jgi:hypothetical protein